MISFGKPVEVIDNFDSEYCYELFLEKVPDSDTNGNVLNRKTLYLKNLIEHELEELHSLVLYAREGNIAEAENHQQGMVTFQRIQDIEQQLEEIHSSPVPDIGPTPPGSIKPSCLQQEPPPKSPAIASDQRHSNAVRYLEPITVQAPLLSTKTNVVQATKVKPSPKSKKPIDTTQLEPQPESPNVSNINNDLTNVPELSLIIKQESLDLIEPICSQVEDIQPITNPELPQQESLVIMDKSVPEVSSSENVKLPEPPSSTNTDTSQSTKDKEYKLKELKNALEEESNKKDNPDTIEKHSSKSKKPQTVSEKEPSVSKKRTSQSTAYDSSSKAKKPKKVPEKEHKASNSKRISQPVIDDGPSSAKKLKNNVSELKQSESNGKSALVTDNSSSKAMKSTKIPEKVASVSNTKHTSLPSLVSLDKSSSKTQKTNKSVDQKSSDSRSKRTSKCEIKDVSSKEKKSKVPEKVPPVSKAKSVSIGNEKCSSKIKTPMKDLTDSKTKNSSKSVMDNTYTKAKKVQNVPEEEPPISKRRLSHFAKVTSSSNAVKSNNKHPSDSDSRRTSQLDKSSISTEKKRSKETKSSAVFKITDSNSNKEKRNSVSGMFFNNNNIWTTYIAPFL